MDQFAAPRERFLVLYGDGDMDCGWTWRPTKEAMLAVVEELRADGTYSEVSALEFAGMDEADHDGLEISPVPFLLLFQGRDTAGWSYCRSADRVSSQIREINTCGDMEIEVYQIERMRAVDLS